jgi:hypothetical protein
VPIPENVDPNARTVCPHGCLVLASAWRKHDAWHRALEERLEGIEDALKEPAPEPELLEWPGADPGPSPDPDPAPVGPYAGPHPGEGAGL